MFLARWRVDLGLGPGQDGIVQQSNRRTAVKFFDQTARFYREREVSGKHRVRGYRRKLAVSYRRATDVATETPMTKKKKRWSELTAEELSAATKPFDDPSYQPAALRPSKKEVASLRQVQRKFPRRPKQ
jgi:hypothetical protein